MKLFTYAKAEGGVVDTIKSHSSHEGSIYLAGGTNLIDLMKEGVLTPDHLVDINGLKYSKVEPAGSGGIKIGALVRNSDLANHELVRKHYPVLSRALLSGASPQLRNMASVGGNLMQRTRCCYFYDITSACNKRQPGSGCPAIDGYNRMHAVLGGSKSCIAVNPSDMNVALAALDATVIVSSAAGERRIKLVDFHKLPGDTPNVENDLKPHELIVSLELPEKGFEKHWAYLKLRDRASYAFALVSVAACLDIDGGKIKEARVALGGVATKPWRMSEAESLLVGKAPSEEAFKKSADLIFKSARGYEHNNFKIEMGKRAVVRALKSAAGGLS